MFTLTHTRRIAVLTMQHGKANALDTEFCLALAAKFDELKSSDAQAVVITGQGRIFSAGVDLLRATTSGPDYFKRLPSGAGQALYEHVLLSEARGRGGQRPRGGRRLHPGLHAPTSA